MIRSSSVLHISILISRPGQEYMTTLSLVNKVPFSFFNYRLLCAKLNILIPCSSIHTMSLASADPQLHWKPNGNPLTT